MGDEFEEWQRLERRWVDWIEQSYVDPSELLDDLQAFANAPASSLLASSAHVLMAGILRDVCERAQAADHLRAAIGLCTADHPSWVEMHWQLMDVLIEAYQPFDALDVVCELLKVENRRPWMASTMPNVALVAMAGGADQRLALLGALSHYERGLEMIEDSERHPLDRATRIRSEYLRQATHRSAGAAE